MRRTLTRLGAAVFGLALAAPGGAQQIALDHPRPCGELVCYPLVSDPTAYYYLPAEPRLATREDGSPEFSFMEYQDLGSVETADGRTQSAGGGIVHFLVDLAVEDEVLREAEAALREGDEEARVVGPVQFLDGTFGLVSTIAAEGDDDGGPEALAYDVVASGRAPLLPGHRAAVSIHLTREGATRLKSSLGMSASDVSIVFELTFAGLRDPTKASITVDWDKVHEQTELEAGFEFGYGPIELGFDYEDFWDGVRDSGAVNIEYEGAPEALKATIERAYEKLQEKLFEPVPMESYEDPAAQAQGVADALMSRASGGQAQDQAPWHLKLKGGYKLRKVTRRGSYRLDFREQTGDTITIALAGNLGNLQERWGDDPRIFRLASTENPAFRARKVVFALDGLHDDAYASYVNSVTVTLRKTHGSGRETVREALFLAADIASLEAKAVTYGWDGEPNQGDFDTYEFQVAWSFVGGATHVEPPTSSVAAAHALSPPFKFREVDFRARAETLREHSVRLVTAKVWYDFFGRERRERVELLPETGELLVTKLFPEPAEGGLFEVELTWLFEDRSVVTEERRPIETSTIFCDILPTS